jgi:hypothetical protein
MFDYYRPANLQHCPVCRRPLQMWQGKEGAKGIFVWVEGKAAPVEQDVDDELRLDSEKRNRLRLPQKFRIYSFDCADHRRIEADGFALGGTWNRTVLRPFGGEWMEGLARLKGGRKRRDP